MSFFDDHHGEPAPELPVEQVSDLRRILRMHANDLSNGACAVCGARPCRSWLDAYDRLAAAGKLMGHPQLWQSYDGAGRR
jgi:hypothetical protein